MRIKGTFLFAILLFIEINAQTNFQLPSLKENSLKNKDTINTSTFSMGLGYVKETHHKNSSPIIEINFNINLYRSIYLNLGSEAAVLFDDMHHDSYGLYFAPNYAFHEEKNRISMFFGAGVYFFTPPIYPKLGWIFFGRAQYNLHRNFSLGLEMKLVKSGNSEIQDNSYISGLFYLSIRL